MNQCFVGWMRASSDRALEAKLAELDRELQSAKPRELEAIAHLRSGILVELAGRV